MNLTIHVLGLELLSVELTTDAASDAESVEGAELAGGTLVSERVSAEAGDTFMGFANGREGDGE